MKCPLCGQKKGKRRCRLDGQEICSPCCAAKRSSECAGCAFYEEASKHTRSTRPTPLRRDVVVMDEIGAQCQAALDLVEAGKMTHGQAVLEHLRLRHPDSHAVLYGLGVCYGLQRRTEEALACLQRAVELRPDDENAYLNLGTAHCQDGDIAKAAAAFQRAVDLDPDGARGWVGGMARHELDELDAITRKTSGVSLEQYLDDKRVFDLGYEALRERRFHEAIGCFERVLASQTKHAQSYGNMAMAYAGLGDKAKALEYLDKALEIDPRYEPALLNGLTVRNMTDGEPLLASSDERLDYYRDFPSKSRSYIQTVLEGLKEKLSLGVDREQRGP